MDTKFRTLQNYLAIYDASSKLLFQCAEDIYNKYDTDVLRSSHASSDPCNITGIPMSKTNTEKQMTLSEYTAYLNDFYTNTIQKQIDAVNIGATLDDARDFKTKKRLLDASYNTLLEKRQDADYMMNELIGTETSVNAEKRNVSDASVYTSILWTTIATTMLYYIFVKL